MTLYRLWSGKVLETEQGAAKYFEADANFLINVTDSLGISTSRLENLRDEAIEAIENGEKPESEEAQKLIAAIFVGDAEWNEPLEYWFQKPFAEIFLYSDGKAHHKGLQRARDFGSLEDLDMPNYSTPSMVSKKSENILENINGLDQLLLTASVLDIEWYGYVAEQMDIDFDKDIIKRTRRETIDHFINDKNFSKDLVKFRKALSINDHIWLDNIMSDFDFNSLALEKISQGMKKEAEKIDKKIEEV